MKETWDFVEIGAFCFEVYLLENEGKLWSQSNIKFEKASYILIFKSFEVLKLKLSSFFFLQESLQHFFVLFVRHTILTTTFQRSPSQERNSSLRLYLLLHYLNSLLIVVKRLQARKTLKIPIARAWLITQFQVISFLSESFVFCCIGVSLFVSYKEKWSVIFIFTALVRLYFFLLCVIFQF